MFDALFLNEHHFLATTFSFNDQEFTGICNTSAPDPDTHPNEHNSIQIAASDQESFLSSVVDPSFADSHIVTTYNATDGRYSDSCQLSAVEGGNLEPWLNFSFDTAPSTYASVQEKHMSIWPGGSFDVSASDFDLNLSETNSCEPIDIDDDWVPQDVFGMGFQDENGGWRCSHAGCRSHTVFERACDLRKHHLTHTKAFFCLRPECAPSGVGFAYQKDYRRHLRSHEPSISCPYASCSRVFSRMDNMVGFLHT
ncbi:C2H2 type zinc finger domain-containing protein [Colletotrichum paranaense]|uniref:C2H2 type zinc finger domain-containing protein n=1 Tax=Colletotrichum paranaense TaxID=1914294 RepID=A0ABQ9SLX3_9PEZI|nr:C2H2 type zinc finger domain-containing protein [Colletotrichum paranaense]KAK1540513.1 C2H2 type zinc finger domain-containing protein [Colletotrichum paranaense]